jgi:hypothetical protein
MIWICHSRTHFSQWWNSYILNLYIDSTFNKIWNEKVPKSLLWLKTSIVAWWLMESMVHEKFNLIKHSWWWNIMIYTKTKWFTKVSIIFFAYLLKSSILRNRSFNDKTGNNLDFSAWHGYNSYLKYDSSIIFWHPFNDI